MTKATRNESVSGQKAADQPGGSGKSTAGTSDDSAEGIKRFRKVIILVLTFVVGVVLIFSLMSALEKQRTEDLTARFFSVFTKPVNAGEEPDLEAVDGVLAEARGRQQEEWFLRVTVEYLLKHADSEDARARLAAADTSSETDTNAETDSAISAEAARAKARSLVGEARERMGTPNVIDWASSVIARLDGLNSNDWRPPPRAYQLPPPAEGTGESEASSPTSSSSEEKTPDSAEAGAEAPSEAEDAASEVPDSGTE